MSLIRHLWVSGALIFGLTVYSGQAQEAKATSLPTEVVESKVSTNSTASQAKPKPARKQKPKSNSDQSENDDKPIAKKAPRDRPKADPIKKPEGVSEDEWKKIVDAYGKPHSGPAPKSGLVARQVARAKNGDASAQYGLALRYLSGDGVSRDSDQARQWLKKSADGKFEPARQLLKQWGTENIDGKENDPKKQ